MTVCTCKAHTKPHDHEWTGTEPLPERPECEHLSKYGCHDWRWSSGMFSEGYECYNCGEIQEPKED